MFIDQVKIYVKGGGGGDGCSSLHNDRWHKYGVPDGGPGGKGGDVILKADENVQTLLDFHYQQHIEGERGGHGSSNNKKGKYGAEHIVLVPCGTIVRDVEEGTVLRDLVCAGDSIVIARGGYGGRGNIGGRGPAMEGKPGESRRVLLELKLIADIGIIGYPNAGKSTLLARISSARPKIANYPFTTREPMLGVVKVFEDAPPFVVADIPGLIEGASAGKGLGHTFLRHIERTRLLVHLVDASGLEGRDPYDDYVKVNKELRLYSKELAKRPQVIVLNKTDLPEAGSQLKAFRKRTRRRIRIISALTGLGVKELLADLFRMLQKK